jgi:hypothetical protein
MILDYFRENNRLSLEQEKELRSLSTLLETNKCDKLSLISKEELAYIFDFSQFTIEQYLELRRIGYNLEQIRMMCGVSTTKFTQWRQKNGLYKSGEKIKMIEYIDKL